RRVYPPPRRQPRPDRPASSRHPAPARPRPPPPAAPPSTRRPATCRPRLPCAPPVCGRAAASPAARSALAWSSGRAPCSCRLAPHQPAIVVDMEAALARLVLLPPPAPGPLILALQNRARAGLAADRGETPLVQRIHRDLLHLAKIEDLLAGPVEERRDLDEVALQHRQRDRAALPRLVGAQPGHPGGRIRQCPVQWLDFADVAAIEPRRLAMVEAVDPGVGDPGGERPRVRVVGADALAVTLLGLLPELVGGRKEAAGVQRHHLDVEPAGEDDVGERLVLQPEAGREHDPPRH